MESLLASGGTRGGLRNPGHNKPLLVRECEIHAFDSRRASDGGCVAAEVLTEATLKLGWIPHLRIEIWGTRDRRTDYPGGVNLRRSKTAWTTRSQRVAGKVKARGLEAPARSISSVRSN